MRFLEDDHPEKDEVYTFVMEKVASLSDHPNICTHFWDPTYWNRGIGPFPRGKSLLWHFMTPLMPATAFRVVLNFLNFEITNNMKRKKMPILRGS